MQHIWKVLLTSLLIFALAATACLAEDSEAQYQAYSYTTFSLRRFLHAVVAVLVREVCNDGNFLVGTFFPFHLFGDRKSTRLNSSHP